MGKNTDNDIFDPADQEVGPELVYANETDESMFIPDTSGDPEGSEERAKPDAISLPDFYFKKYQLDEQGNPTFNASRVKGIMEVFMAKKDSPFTIPTEDEDRKAKELELFDAHVQSVADGLMPLLEVDPQTTGINFLQLTTRTWAEFASIAYEYNEDATASNPNDDLPDWLIEREDKMFQLGRKARMCREVLARVDDKFGLNDTKINDSRVQNEVERRLQRLAEWNYNKQADRSGKVAMDLNKESHEHVKQVFELC